MTDRWWTIAAWLALVGAAMVLGSGCACDCPASWNVGWPALPRTHERRRPDEALRWEDPLHFMGPCDGGR